MRATIGWAGSDEAIEAVALVSVGVEVDRRLLEILPSIAHLQERSS